MPKWVFRNVPLHPFLFPPQLHTLLNSKVPATGGEEPVDHDFDVVSHHNCDYNDNGKGLQIDVDKIIGGSKEEVRTKDDKIDITLNKLKRAKFCPCPFLIIFFYSPDSFSQPKDSDYGVYIPEYETDAELI